MNRTRLSGCVALVIAALAVSASAAAQGQSAAQLKPIEPVAAIGEAFGTHDIVALDEAGIATSRPTTFA